MNVCLVRKRGSKGLIEVRDREEYSTIFTRILLSDKVWHSQSQAVPKKRYQCTDNDDFFGDGSIIGDRRENS